MGVTRVRKRTHDLPHRCSNNFLAINVRLLRCSQDGDWRYKSSELISCGGPPRAAFSSQ
jgi:hypothetical protein